MDSNLISQLQKVQIIGQIYSVTKPQPPPQPAATVAGPGPECCLPDVAHIAQQAHGLTAGNEMQQLIKKYASRWYITSMSEVIL